MPNVIFVIRFDVALAIIDHFKLALQQHVGTRLLRLRGLFFLNVLVVESKLVIVATGSSRDSFCAAVHGVGLSALTFDMSGSRRQRGLGPE